jgi:hypothetical protein|mmetsp:Transcript_26560/g.48200  ORF Transcript_26560/g.48200 Transcript_26560/m.48200 type:complete len:96 (+) Transcript_26560:1792-2079(+)
MMTVMMKDIVRRLQKRNLLRFTTETNNTLELEELDNNKKHTTSNIPNNNKSFWTNSHPSHHLRHHSYGELEPAFLPVAPVAPHRFSIGLEGQVIL